MKRYEYIRLPIDFGDLAALNRFGSEGWHVVSVVRDSMSGTVALLEREIPPRKSKP